MDFKEWLDTFVKNNYPATDVANWPEEYGEDSPFEPVPSKFDKVKINVDNLILLLQQNGYVVPEEYEEYYKQCNVVPVAYSALDESARSYGIFLEFGPNVLNVKYFGNTYVINITGGYTKGLVEILTEYKDEIEALTLEKNASQEETIYFCTDFTYEFSRYTTGSWMNYALVSKMRQCTPNKFDNIFIPTE